MRSSRDRGARPRLVGRIDRRFGYSKEGVGGGYDMTNTVGSSVISGAEFTGSERLGGGKQMRTGMFIRENRRSDVLWCALHMVCNHTFKFREDLW